MPAPILCVGAAHWDLIGRAAGPLGPGADAPGRIERRPGGVAANVALALAALGRPAALLSAVGRDGPGERLVEALAGQGVDCTHLLRHAGPTDGYLAIEDGAGELFAAVADCAGLERAGIAVLRPLLDGPLADDARPWRGWIVIDGNLPGAAQDALLRAPATRSARLALVPASPAKAARLGPALVAPNVTLYLNRREAEALCRQTFPDSRAAAAALVERGAAEAIVTDGAAPVTHASRGHVLSLPPPPVATRSLTGAGDAFLAAHLAARDDGLAPEPALRAALAASARHISREAS
jgi:sugar/nucleoside kinase (ribokinase family)